MPPTKGQELCRIPSQTLLAEERQSQRQIRYFLQKGDNEALLVYTLVHI